MSTFFGRVLLSILIGVGAAVGFRSDVGGELDKTLREAKVSLSEKANIAVDSAREVKTRVNNSVLVSAQANANSKASVKYNAKADAKTKGNLDVQVITGGNLIDNVVSDLSVDGSLDTNSQTTVGADAQGPELDLKNKAKSTLDLSLDILK
jgi:hypothetical protein